MKKTLLKSTLLLLFLFIFSTSYSQTEEIFLTNPSFEDMATIPGIPPRGWYDCGRINFPNETPPDVHPNKKAPSFGVTKKAFHGKTYLGMVVRENDSWESVAQRLKEPLLADSCYAFKIALSKSKVYESKIRGQEEQISFIEPALLRIWGGEGYCTKEELLAESELISNTEWIDYTFKIEPSKDYNYIILEAFFELPTYIPPNGNLMLDDASSFSLIPCDNETEAKFTEVDLPKIANEETRNKYVAGKTELKRAIKIEGKYILFNENELTEDGLERLKYLGNLMDSFTQYKLILDLNGMKRKKAKARMMQIKNALLEEGLTTEEFEVRNSNYDDGKVRWLVEKEELCIGLLLNKE